MIKMQPDLINIPDSGFNEYGWKRVQVNCMNAYDERTCMYGIFWFAYEDS